MRNFEASELQSSMASELPGLGLRVWGLGFRDLEFRVWGLGFGV